MRNFVLVNSKTFIMKTKLSFLALLLSHFCLAQYPASGLMAQYGFNNGSLLVDGVSGANFTQTGTALTQINDRFGNAPTSAISLNGDYLTRPAINYPTDLSISFWIKTNTNDTNRRTIFDDKATDTGFYIFIENGKIGISATHQRTPIGFPITFRTFEFISNTVVSDGQWHNITFTIEFDQIRNIANILKGHIFTINLRTDLVLESFVDTINTNTTLQVVSNTNNNSGSVKIANNRTNTLSNNNRYFDSIDDILIYNRLLTAAEITTIVNYNNNLATENFNTAKLELAIYPNPAKSILNINTDEEINTIEIYTLEGKKVLESNTKQIDVSPITKGLYLVKIVTTANKTACKKFVKE
jgi:Secretion system C-terminal sorting domain/Concanavalin A-like lectin/glucanases superfamily